MSLYQSHHRPMVPEVEAGGQLLYGVSGLFCAISLSLQLRVAPTIGLLEGRQVIVILFP